MHLLSLLALPAAAPPKVAVVYSAWSNSVFIDEWDDELQALGWPCEKFENVRIADLAPRLGEFDLVIATSVGNLENAQDMTPYREQWLGFLNQGGCLLITDASYGTALNQWVNTFGPEYALATATCAAHREQTPESRETTFADHSLMTCPNDLAPLLRTRWMIWAHLDSWPEGWESLITCKDGKSLFLARPVGKGLLIVTSHYAFRTPGDRAAGVALLENVWLNASNGRSGLRVTRLQFGPAAPGPAKAEFEARNETAGELSLRARIDLEVEGQPPMVGEAVTGKAISGGTTALSAPYSVTSRGKVTARLVVEDEAGRRLLDWPKTLDIPPAVVIDLKRKHLYPRQPKLEATLSLAPPVGAQKLAVACYLDGQFHLMIADPTPSMPLSVPSEKLPIGQHTLSVRMLADDAQVGETFAEFFRHPTPRWEVREDGVTLLEGKPFFPFGFYHVSQSFDAAHRLKMAQDIAAAGFNCAHTRIMEFESYDAFLDECAKLGVYIVTEFSTPLFETVERYKNHPAVLAWNPGDEPELNGLPADEFFTRYDRFKQTAPDHLVYAVIASPNEYRRYAKGTDVLAPDVYPVPHSPVTAVYRQLRQASAEAAKYDTMLWGVLQCFGGYGGWTRPPTPQELRAMTYLALLAGVKGILYYTYGDQGWVVTDHPEQWEAAKALVPEINHLAPALLDGKFTLLSEGDNDIYAGKWEYQGKTYTIVVNTAQEERTFGDVGKLGPIETVVREE
ncbi:MAG: hypothetical protein FJX75_16680 [Armatimonadetes bacterium]|nr:hypothetical protein [Armatimonadota bacterium]